jgi:hypothetical protein
MTFNELPTNQKLLFVAHVLGATAAFIAAYASILNMADRAALPNDNLIKPNPQSDTGRSRSYFEQ